MNRNRAALTGALVADAASLGFHWLYNQERIASLAGAAPEFRAPNAADYLGPDGDGLGYFAHEGKRPGDPSHYGAQMLAMADALGPEGYNPEEYAARFREWFGYGGQWVGYIDRPTRATLNRMAEAEAEEEPLTTCGADDAQLPAISKLPPLVIRHQGASNLRALVESAVRVTNDRDDAVAWGLAIAAMIEAALKGASPEETVAAARGVTPHIDSQIEAALALRGKSAEEAAQTFALHCQLEAAFPVIIHLVANAGNYRDAIRANIRAGGDSCGRAIPLGAILGACFADDAAKGVPSEWLGRVSVPGALTALF